MRTIYIITLLSLFIGSCKHEIDYADFTNAEYIVSDNIFKETINLSGIQAKDSVKININKPEVFLKDSILVVLNRRDNSTVHLFKVPGFKYLGSFGRKGRGPMEFLYPSIIPLSGDNIICGIFDNATGKIYQITKSLTMQRIKSGSLEDTPIYSSRQMIYLHMNNLVYIQSSDKNRLISSTNTNDNTEKDLYNLALEPKLNSYFTYLGIATANIEKDRMVYAYNYFKVLKFMTLDTKTVKTFNFNLPGFDISTLKVADGLDLNNLYYWGSIVAQDEYVYVEIINKTADQLQSDKENNIHTTVIEQYDWDGKPIRQIKLDKEGRFVVDEKNEVIYLVSEYDNPPFFTYKLPTPL